MIAEEVAKFIEILGLGIFDPEGTTGNIFIEQLPDLPEKAIALYSSGAASADSKLNYDLVTVQILVRGSEDPRDAQSLAQEIYNELHAFGDAPFISGGSYIVSCLGLQSQPILLGKNDKGNFEYSLNFDIEFQNLGSRRRE